MSDDRMHILCAADHIFGPWLGVMVSSVLTQDHGRPVTVHVFSEGIQGADLRRLRRLCQDRGATLHVYDVSRLIALEAKDFRIDYFLSRTTYARLFLDRLLDPLVERVLYIDADIVCIGSLQALWETDLSAAVLAAAPDILAPESLRAVNERLGRPEGLPYHNAGVLLIDVARWRAEAIGERLVGYIRTMGERLASHDQDAINGFLGEKIKPLERRWNFLAVQGAATDGSEVLIHFVGFRKPWYLGCGAALAPHFLRAKAASPWRWKPRLPYMVRKLRFSMRKRLQKLATIRRRVGL